MKFKELKSIIDNVKLDHPDLPRDFIRALPISKNPKSIAEPFVFNEKPEKPKRTKK